MTVSTTTLKNSYAGNGTTDAFSYTFKVFAASELTVLIRNDATGTETLKTLTTHFSVSGVGNAGGGTVTFTAGNIPATGETVVLLRDTSLQQLTDYQPADPFPAASHEDALDKLTHMVQEVQEEVDRSFKVSRTNSITTTQFTEGATTRANKLLSFDASGDLAVTQEIGVYEGDWSASTAYSVRDLVKDTSTNNIFICVTAHTSSGAQPLTTNTDSAKWSLIVDAASASTSATAAASSATAAAASATAAAASESASATSESNSASSASSASTSAGTATTQAGVATTQAGLATTAKTASEAAQAASEAAQAAAETAETNSASSASASATSATSSASSASASASSSSSASASAAAAAASANAAEAAAAAVFFEYETSTSMTNPSAGGVRFNNASMASVTQICFSATSASTGNPDVSDYIVTWDDSTSPTKGHVIIRESGTPGSNIVFAVNGSVTDNTTHLIVPVAHVSSAGVSLSASDDLYFSFSRTGDAGAGSGDLQAANNLSDLANVATARTNLGLGTAATTAATDYAAVANNLSDLANAGTARTNLGLGTAATSASTDFEAADADILKADTADVLTAGFAATPYNAGTQTSGTYTPDEANGNLQYAVNGGAHTLAPPTNNCTIVIQYTNNASAGAITTSGFTLVDGDTISTTNGDDFFFYLTKLNGFSHLTVKALQ